MCGIAGVINFAGDSPSGERLQRACASLAHRGPDGSGQWISDHGPPAVGLAHTRLAVIDPTPNGNQPLFDAISRVVIVFNGLVYNYPQLRAELEGEGFAFKTATDTEVILNAYLHWGESCLSRLRGMYAFCLYDTRARTGMLCRDPFGIKPLTYSLADKQLIFASELGALQQLSDAPSELCRSALGEYLRFGYIAPPATIYEQYHKLLPGHVLRFSAHGAQPARRYAKMCAGSDMSQLSYDEAVPMLRQRIGDSVCARTIADVPLGAFLSGGLDSAIVVAHLAETTRDLRTFSIGFGDEPRYDESAAARELSQVFGTHHYPFNLRFRDVIAELPALLDSLAEPFADASLVPSSLLSARTRRQVTVALSGDGADELFGGYYRYAAHHYHRLVQRVPGVLRRGLLKPALRLLPSAKSSAFSDRVRQMRKLLRTEEANAIARHQAWSRICSPHLERVLDPNGELFPPAPTAQQWLDCVDPQLRRHWANDPLNLIMLIDLNHQLPGDMLHKVDLASMAHNLEVRVPFLDPGVVELAVRLPSSFKIQGKTRKRILRDAYRDVLPASVLQRPKRGFELPIGEFLRNELRELFRDTVTPATISALPGLSHEGVLSIYKQHCRRRGEYADLLWAIMVLCWWQRRRG